MLGGDTRPRGHRAPGCRQVLPWTMLRGLEPSLVHPFRAPALLAGSLWGCMEQGLVSICEGAGVSLHHPCCATWGRSPHHYSLVGSAEMGAGGGGQCQGKRERAWSRVELGSMQGKSMAAWASMARAPCLCGFSCERQHSLPKLERCGPQKEIVMGKHHRSTL